MNPLNNTAASNSATQSYVNQARQQGQQLQNQWNTQTTQNQGQYNQAVNNTQNAYNNLSNFSNNVGNYAQKYTNQMQNAYGYNPNVTQGLESAYLPTLQQVTKLNEAYANAPKEAQQMANYGGVTAGAMANNLSNMASNLAQGQAGANAQLSGLSSGIGSQAQLAGVVSGAANQELSTKQTALNNVYTQANQQMATAAQTMNNVEQLAANQGYLTAQQTTAYENARSQYIQNRAAAAQAYSQTRLNNLTSQQMQNEMNSAGYKRMMGNPNIDPFTGQTIGGSSNSGNSTSGKPTPNKFNSTQYIQKGENLINQLIANNKNKNSLGNIFGGRTTQDKQDVQNLYNTISLINSLAPSNQKQSTINAIKQFFQNNVNSLDPNIANGSIDKFNPNTPITSLNANNILGYLGS